MTVRRRHGMPGILTHPLSYVRAERNWTYQDVADAIGRHINTASRREKVWRWEHWGVVPDRASQLALAAELGIPPERVSRDHWPRWLPAGDSIRASYGWTQAGSLEALEDTLELAAADRRGFMLLLGATLVGLAETWMRIEPAELAAALRGGRVTGDFVDRIEEGLPRLRFIDATYGGDRARRLIEAEFGVVVDVLSRSSYTARVAVRLHALAAELARMAGWSSFDAGLHAAAQRYWTAGLYAAHAAGDRGLGSNILKSMSLQCYDFHQPTEALALAASANHSAAAATPRTRAMFALRQARAHAALREPAACQRLMAEADTLVSRAQGDDDPTWVGYFDQAEFHAQIGTCYLDLDRPDLADRHLATTLDSLPDAKVRDRATYLTRRALAMVHLGDADHACQLLLSAVPLIEQAPSQRNLERIRRVRDQMPFSRRDRRTDELDQQLAALTQ